jgi:two-component system response regulator HydG
MRDRARILVIDDEESLRYTFENFLVGEGYDVYTAMDFDGAVAKIETTAFDLIFVDIVLGGRTGIDVIREVKARGMTCPVVIITGAPSIESASEAVRLGAFDYIPKPIRQDTLLRVTRMALQHQAVSQEKENFRLHLEAIFRSVKDAIITTDNELKVVELNRAAADICGLSRGAIGEPFGSLLMGCRRNCLELLITAVEKRELVEAHYVECNRQDRRGQVVSLCASPLLDQHGIFSGAVLVVRDETRLASLERDLKERQQFHALVGKSEKMQEVYSLIESLCDVQTTVLITGESGTGKELVAEALHYKGSRSQRPLVKVNCSALSENLLESELFGHVKGAFTGAVRDKIGRFQRADGGTIFLDEVGDISHRIQLRLLRVLQEMEFERVGDSTPVKVDVRVITATNQDLYEKVKRGEFREDLYYRLKVVEIALPPLRDRLEDIPILVDHFLKKFSQKFNKEITSVSADVRKTFMHHTWPGNIRELDHALEHAFILCRQDIITVEHLPRGFSRAVSESSATSREGTHENESREIIHALEKTAWNKAKAARLLGLDRKTLYRKIWRYKIQKDSGQ